VGAGNTCRTFLLCFGRHSFVDQFPDDCGFVFGFGKELEQFRILVSVDPEIYADGIFCIPSGL
jgi:hypothetical protein